MGRSTTPTFVVAYQDQKGIHKVIWNTKTAGKPTLANLEKWRKVMNDSFKPGGCNDGWNTVHGFILHISNCQIVNQKKGCVVVDFKAPMFEEM